MIAPAEFFAKPLVFLFQTQKIERLFYRANGFFEGERLFDEIEGSQFGGAYRGFDVAVSGNHHHHGEVAFLAHAFEGLEAIHFWQPDVEQHQVDRAACETRQTLFAGGHRFDRVTLLAEDGGERVANAGFVVDDENGVSHVWALFQWLSRLLWS